MKTPFKNIGIDLKGYRLTKKQLQAWIDTQTPHVVAVHSYGGIYTSKGDGVYESIDEIFHSLEDFWKHVRSNKQAIMWEVQ